MLLILNNSQINEYNTILIIIINYRCRKNKIQDIIIYSDMNVV